MAKVILNIPSPEVDKRSAIRCFIVSSLLPHCRIAIEKLLMLPRRNITLPFYHMITSIHHLIETHVEDLVKKNVKKELKWAHNLAGALILGSDMVSDVTELLIAFFKMSYNVFSAVEDNRPLELANKMQDMAVEIVDLLCDPQVFNLMFLVKSALKQTADKVITEIIRKRCEYSITESILFHVLQKYKSIMKWTSSLWVENKLTIPVIDMRTVAEKCLITNLSERIYDLTVVKYPASYVLIEELKFCMENNSHYGRQKIVQLLSDEVRKKLLHVGRSTTEILQGYATCVECLRSLDPTCVIMHTICSIIRQYIKRRPDTVRCIITYITGEKRDEMSKQLSNKKGAIVDEEDMAGVNDELIPCGLNQSIIDDNWSEWTPDPPDANLTQSRRFRQDADVFNMLVSVYGSKEAFVKEYRELLAERLTKSWNRDPIFEQKYLDLLKLRFSEGELQQCEVMLKDMRDSERMDRLIAPSLPFPISARIISSFFWPKIDGEHFKMPEALMQGLSVYSECFERHKGSRKLDWMTSVGSVEINLELDGFCVSLAASPAHTAVLIPFTEQEIWTLDELSSAIEMDRRNVKKRLEWWQNNGVVHLSAKENDNDSETWQLGIGSAKMDRLGIEQELEDETSDDDQAEDSTAVDALEQYWTYTRSFIANQEPIKAERLHSIFRMFTSPGQQGPTIQEVVAFLQRKVKMGLLACTNDSYKVVKESASQ